MKVRHALITAANPRQRTLPLQTLSDRDGIARSALEIVLREAAGAGIEEFVVVVCPGDEAAYAVAAGDLRDRVQFAIQAEPLGYRDAVLQGRHIVGDHPFLHLVGDHLHLSDTTVSCARQLLEIAAAEQAPVSSVPPTRESQLTSFGAIGGKLVGGDTPLYEIEAVLEKPTPTVAEQELLVPGMRAGFYLCFFGLHVLDSEIFSLLDEQRAAAPSAPLGLSAALHTLGLPPTLPGPEN
ncbi:MAG: UTP--glucose-1-phosphate uridylyltransferase [Candidatus Synoicihabitans palmerolidicus]|nr:UTP--glucose-1-phosphate uridylyltransferase [Candidatus Synoicihabitans palmerolidicus]